MTKTSSLLLIVLIAAVPAYAFNPYLDLSNGFVQLKKLSVTPASAPAPRAQPPAEPPAPQIIEAPEEVQPAPSVPAQDTNSEVVGGSAPAEVPSESELTSSLRPKARPSKAPKKETKEPPAETTAKGAPTIYDMRGCTYARGSGSNSKCYKSMSTVDRAKRIMTAVNYVNKLHKTQFDGRYMLCTGFRESNFNPGARGADGERGMFQVMKATGKGAIKYGVKLPEFKGLDAETYMTKMSNSTVAQVELSFLVLKMKLVEDGNDSRQSRIMSGEGSVADYQYLAGRYNGGGTKSVYAKRISGCYSCLRGKMAANATNIDSGIQSCLNKAK